jgi:uncharacterized RDD family membrane protein YckC
MAEPHAAATPTPSGLPPAPALRRRLLCLVYEGVLLFGVVMLAGFVYGTITQQRHALQGLHGLQAFVFLVVGLYFVGFWSRVGQTLPMRTWRILLVDLAGRPVRPLRAAVRYVLCWAWFLPALVAIPLLGLNGGGPVSLALGIGVLAYASLARFLPGRQFLHDLACGTRLVDQRTLDTPRVHRPGALP